jgi:hypothetical protein
LCYSGIQQQGNSSTDVVKKSMVKALYEPVLLLLFDIDDEQ